MQIGNLSVEVRRKAIKNLHISVLPPSGVVRVSAPLKMSDDAVKMQKILDALENVDDVQQVYTNAVIDEE